MQFLDTLVPIPSLFCERKPASDIIQHYHTPVTTATSVLGIKFDKGVLIAADILASYGSLARFKSCNRIVSVNKNILVGAGGDYADFQYLMELLKSKSIDEECLEDDLCMKPAALHCWLTRVLYERRSKVDPLWNNILIAGMQDGIPFLGTVDKLGTAFNDDVIATGYGSYIAIPLLRQLVDKKSITLVEAEEAIRKCMEVLYYRDARSFNKYQLGVITADCSEVKGPFDIKGNWSVSHGVCGYE